MFDLRAAATPACARRKSSALPPGTPISRGFIRPPDGYNHPNSTSPWQVAFRGADPQAPLPGSEEGWRGMTSAGTIRVLCVDDHPLVRDGVKFAVQAQNDMEWVGEASNGQQAVEQANLHRP